MYRIGTFHVFFFFSSFFKGGWDGEYRNNLKRFEQKQMGFHSC